MWLRPDGVSVEGAVRQSVSLGLFSSAGFDVRTWSVRDGRATIGLRDPLPVRCTASELILDGTSLRYRADPGTEASFENAFDPDGWVGAPFLR